MSFAPENETLAKPESLFRVPVGLASPLWGLFAGAAMTGAAWWWMTRWTQVENLEAMFGSAAEAQPGVEAEAQVAALAAPAVEAPQAVLDALVQAPVEFPPVGGEAGPISPVLEVLAPEIAEPRAIEASAEADAEAAAAPKAKRKPAEAQPTDKTA